MPIKWVQCALCGHTKNISAFPEPEKKSLQKSGFGVCKVCSGFTPQHSLISPKLIRFYDFMEANSLDRR